MTFFSWAALGYSFKFIWAPVVDLLPVPWLTRKLGRRRSWLFLAQVGVIIAISWMGAVNPADNLENLSLMAMAAVMLGFSSATQDIAIDAYRIECAEESMQAMLASMYIAGYRVGMLVAGAGSLFLASYLGTTRALYNYGAWRTTYLCMAAFMLIGIITTFSIKEPELENEVRHDYTLSEYLRFLVLFIFVVMAFVLTFFYSGPVVAQLKDFFTGLFVKEKGVTAFLAELLRFILALLVAFLVAGFFEKSGVVDSKMVRRTYVDPIADFFVRYSGKTALLILLLVGFYRLSDIVLGVVSNVFYLDMGFSKNVIAGITKSFGLGMTLLGGFFGGC
ncbi:hypothetical protein DGMP_17220 [Desulfomarina profundi]|uniref:MFS transporter n=1 Tax=Desulfomarina profundi TaxID=2772557 RepID=A0A8D5FSQ6_9BACT|nr:hypothetical protein DGMP_17220 [Desulfomarina profundi]